MPLRPTARDLALYITIAMAIVVAMVLWVFFVPERFHFRVNRVWLLFGCNTVLLWALLVRAFRRVKWSPRLWLILAVSLIVHTAVYSLLFRVVAPWPWISYVVTMPAEGMAITYIISKWLNVLPMDIEGQEKESALK